MTQQGRVPVLVGVGTVTQRLDEASLPGRGAVELMAEAARRAVGDSGVAGVGAVVDVIVIPQGTWLHTDPAGAVANAVGAPHARAVVGLIGVLQQTLISHACDRITAGDARAVLVVGGEAMARPRVAARAGVDVPDDPGVGVLERVDDLLRPDGDIVTRMEIERHLAVPVVQYALIESVLAHRAGRTPVEQEQHVARLWARGSEVATGQDDAWTREPWDALALAGAGQGNRLLASPYRRWCVSDWNVDQAVALLLTSAELAEEHGVAPQRLVTPVAAAETNHMVPLPSRADLAASAAWRLIGAELASATGTPPAQADLLDLYSCFPAAVQVAALELGIPLDQRPWTVTGGMTFGGGPLNSYALHATATMSRRLRSGARDATGFVTCVSGMLTKVAGALWRAGPPRSPFRNLDVSERDAALTEVCPLDPDLTGDARVVAATVVHERGEPARALAIVEAADGRRSAVVAEGPEAARAWLGSDRIGETVSIRLPGVVD